MMNNVKNKRLIWTVLFMWLYFLTPIRAASEDSVDVQEIVFSHIQDAYTWHITEWNGKEIAIPLPVLIKSEERGWDLFLYIKIRFIIIIILQPMVNMLERL